MRAVTISHLTCRCPGSPWFGHGIAGCAHCMSQANFEFFERAWLEREEGKPDTIVTRHMTVDHLVASMEYWRKRAG